MLNANAVEGATLIGAMLAYPMYGTLVCQVASYFKRFPDDLRHLKVVVALIFVASSVGIVINVNLIWYYCIRRGIGVDPHILQYCDHWTISVFFIPNEITCFLAEALYLKRMWTLSKRRYPNVLALVLFMLGWVFTIVYIQGMFRHSCYPELQLNQPYLFTCLGLRFLSDGLIAGTMCTLLYQQTSDMPKGVISNRPNFMRIVNSLVAWTVSTGLVMWVSAIAFVLTYILLPKTYVALAVYLVRGNIYANAVLALLHVRTRYRKVADEVISLHVQVQVDSVSSNGGGLTRRS